MRSTLRALCLAVFLAPGLVLAAGGGGGGGGGGDLGGGGFSSPRENQSPEAAAKQAHKKGLRYRKAALKAEAKAAEADDAEDRAEYLADAKKDWERAIEQYKRALALNRNLVESWNEFGFALRKTGDFTTSIKAYNTALSLNAEYGDAIEYRAEAYLALNQFDQVREAYTKLLSLDAENAATLMAAMQTWSAARSPLEDADAEAAAKAFASWVAERATLAVFLDAKPRSWDDASDGA